MKRRTIGIGMIGCGTIATTAHLPAVAALPGVRLVAAASKTEAHAKDAAKKWGAKGYYTNYGDLLKRDDVDAVILATSNATLARIGIASAEAGKHVLCEKPMALSSKEAKELIRACKKAGVKLQIGYNQRFWAANRLARKLIDKGFLGKIRACRSTFRQKWSLYGTMSNYRDNLSMSGGYAIMDLAVHRIDLLRWLVGDFTEVSATIRHTTIPNSTLDDNVWIVAGFANGAYGCIDADKISPSMCSLTEIYGTEGVLYSSTETVNPFQPAPLAVYSEHRLKELEEFRSTAMVPFWDEEEGQKKWVTFYPDRENPFVSQLREFTQAIVADTAPLVDGHDGYKVLEVVLAAYASSREGGRVKLPLRRDATTPGYVPAR